MSPLRHNTSTWICTTRDYVWPVKTLDPDYLAPRHLNVRMMLLLLVLILMAFLCMAKKGAK